jgi:hypothetical protein
VSEELSRLLAGELSEADARALRARIAVDPDLARQWALLQQLPDALSALPPPEPPSALNRRVLQTVGGQPPWRRRLVAEWLPAGVVGALLAASVLLLLSPDAAPKPPVLVEGVALLEGVTALQAGPVLVQVDGRAHISVEPTPGPARERGWEAEMDRTHLLAALAGAAVTVTVLEGRALVGGDDSSAAVVVASGDTLRVGGGAAGPGTAVAAGALPAGSRSSGSAEAAAPAPSLEQQLDEARFQLALARGQLTRLEGAPQAWPADLPASLRPEAFSAALRAAVEGSGKVLAIDCEEHPCVAFIETNSPDQGAEQALTAAIEPLAESVEGGAGLMMMAYRSDDGDSASTVAAVALIPGQGEPDEGLHTRIETRARNGVQALRESGDAH